MWHSGLKWWRIGVSTNVCLNWVNANLALGIKKAILTSLFLELEGKSWFLDFTTILDLVVFAWFFPFVEFGWLIALPQSTILLPTTLSPPVLPLVSLGFTVDLVLPVVFSIEVSGAAMRLKPWINRQQKLVNPRKT